MIPEPTQDPPPSLTLHHHRRGSPPPPPQMATAPAKSQPLHNFSLTHLKWGKNQTTNHRARKPTDDHHRSSPSEAESDGDHKLPPSSSAAGSTKNNGGGEGDRVDDGKSNSNLLVRFPKLSIAAARNGGGTEEGEAEEAVGKPWNLRPRRYLFKSPNNETSAAGGVGGGGGAPKNGEMEEKQENHSKAGRLRGAAEAENGEKKEKRTLWISLSREEIEEDYFVLTGSKLPRRPKKRNRTVQKQLDNCFPGLWLSGITVDLYNVPEPSSKK